jgi:RHS repeat-associated protein
MKTHPWKRAASATLAFLQLVASTPVFALPNAAGSASQSKPTIVVNRSLPVGHPPSLTPSFSDPPTDSEIFSFRFLEDPLVPMLGATTPQENRTLVKALLAYRHRSNPEDFSAILDFIEEYPHSAWRVSLLANLGYAYRRAGYFSKALASWEEAWQLGQDVTESQARVVLDRVAGEIAQLNAWVGRYEVLEPFLQSLRDRELVAPAMVKVSNAREGLWLMQNDPGQAFKCGPFAVGNVYANLHPGAATPSQVSAAISTDKGTSLAQLHTLAEEMGLRFQVAKRSPGAPIPLPAIVRWKLGHYGALIREQGGRYLLQDPSFDGSYGAEQWVSRKVIDEEASRYFLVPDGALPSGWDPVIDAEARLVWGRGATKLSNQDSTTPQDKKVGGNQCPGSSGMARYSVHAMLVSLNIADSPVGYTPPRGPAIDFTVTYNQKEANQPSLFNFSNLGHNWTHNWLSYIEDFCTNVIVGDDTVLVVDSSLGANLYVRGGGMIRYGSFDTNTQSFAHEIRSGATLVRVSADVYERRFPDGSKEVYGLVDSGANSRRVFLTQVVDPATNTVTLDYDGMMRLTAIHDAIGQVTTLSYDMASDPLKITKVTDPFSRSASFCYNSLCDTTGTVDKLTQITDVIGLTSEFTYQGNFINALITPYGTNSFFYSESITNLTTGQDSADYMRFIEVTDPLGQKERTEYTNKILDRAGDGGTPDGFDNSYMDYRNTYFWDKKAMHDYPGDYHKAQLIHWMHDFNAVNNDYVTSGYIESEKKPLESRVWYSYWNQDYNYHYVNTNMLARPAQIARVLDNGTNQVYRFAYNDAGNVTKSIDPIGRVTAYQYDSNQTDLTGVQQAEISGFTTNWAMLAHFAYNAQHLPVKTIDASGQTNVFTYNSFGQLLSVTNALGQTTSMFYDGDGYLTNVVGAVAGAKTSFAYDRDAYGHVLYGRVKSVTDSEGYSVTFDYDALDRITQVTHPDNTTEQLVYDKLDPIWKKDRLNRWTRSFYNANRQLIAVIDAMERTTRFEYCNCGALESLTDPLGHTTTWTRDVQGRVISKHYDDGSQTSNTYENATSRMKQITDAKGEQTIFDYSIDNDLKQIMYSNSVIQTPSVSYTYDANYNRILTMVDGAGTTTYDYSPITNPPTLGAGRLVSIDGPLGNDTITYAYDALGRVAARAINAVTNSVFYDALGRVSSVTNALGGFSYAYTNATPRLSSISYPNGQSTAFNYFGNTGDQRLQEIQNLNSASQVLSKFDYTYNAAGQILTWTQQNDSSTPNSYSFTYDTVDQLLGATLRNASTLAVVKRYFYGYDKAGNRTSEQVDDGVTSAVANDLNQITSLTGGGTLRFRGSANETSTVNVAGIPASVTWTNIAGTNTLFDASAPVAVGTNVIRVIATDPSSNARTNDYQVIVGAVANRVLLYDLNGNLTNIASGSISTNYQWDAANRLVGIMAINGTSTNSTAFTYDGLSRRVRIMEIGDTTTNSDKLFVWCGSELCEERDSISANITKRFFAQGEQIGGTNYFFTRDHLGSIREMVDSSCTNIVARYDYDLYGRRTKSSGNLDADFGFMGQYFHAPSGLHFAFCRVYSSNLGRWLSKDPIQEAGGKNLYAYVGGNPARFIDPQGLFLGLDTTAGEAYNYWVNKASQGFDQGGFWGNAQAAGASLLTGVIDLFHARDVENLASQSGAAAGCGDYWDATWYGLLTLGEIGAVATQAIGAMGAADAAIAEARMNDAMTEIEDYLGGPGEVIENESGDTIIMRGDKKIRFDINNTGGDEPHFHIEQQSPNGKWRDAGGQHRYYF